MSPLDWTLIGFALIAVGWIAGVLALVVAGRRADAEALARFIGDCVVALRRLLGDPRVSRGRKLVLVALVSYLLMPFDLVPDFIPVAGQLDDVIVAAIALRLALRAGGPELLRQHWPGPERSLAAVVRVAYGRPPG